MGRLNIKLNSHPRFRNFISPFYFESIVGQITSQNYGEAISLRSSLRLALEKTGVSQMLDWLVVRKYVCFPQRIETKLNSFIKSDVIDAQRTFPKNKSIKKYQENFCFPSLWGRKDTFHLPFMNGSLVKTKEVDTNLEDLDRVSAGKLLSYCLRTTVLDTCN